VNASDYRPEPTESVAAIADARATVRKRPWVVGLWRVVVVATWRDVMEGLRQLGEDIERERRHDEGPG
jgi:hypothetical protein